MMGNWLAHLLYIMLLLYTNFGAVQSNIYRNNAHGKKSSKMLFVFGDSYADTGNHMKALAYSWKEPYGVTFPGKPTGRFSDGRVLTDFLVIGTRSPLPYKWKKLSQKHFRHGMNFAYGGTGVFDSQVPAPNLTAQVDLFDGMIREGVFTQWDVSSSVALVSIAGNDYTTYVANGGTIENVRPFSKSLIKRLAIDLKRIHGIGVRKVVVTALEPIGCLPTATISLYYQKCNRSANTVSLVHNTFLKRAIQEINKDAKGAKKIAIFDLYKVFMSILHSPQGSESWNLMNTLRPCCEGVRPDLSCGNMASNSTKLYTVCDKPQSVFFWDGVHPSQGGWTAVSSYLRKTLSELY